MRCQSLSGRLGVVLGFTVGFEILFVVGLALAVSLFTVNQRADVRHRPNHVIVVAGQPLLAKWQSPGREFDLHTLDGKPYVLTEKQTGLGGAALPSPAEVRREIGSPGAPSWMAVPFRHGSDWKSLWYFIDEQHGERRTGYIVFYPSDAKAPGFYVGADGQAVSGLTREQRFQLQPGSNSVLVEQANDLVRSRYASILEGSTLENAPTVSGGILLVSKGGLDRVDLRSKEVTRLVADTDLQSAMSEQRYEFDPKSRPFSLLTMAVGSIVRGDKTVYHLEGSVVQAKYLLPETLRDESVGAFAVSPDKIFYTTSAKDTYWSYALYRPTRLMHCAADGRIVEEWKIEQAPQPTESQWFQELSLAVLWAGPVQYLPVQWIGGAESNRSLRERLVEGWPRGLLLVWCGLLSALAAWKFAPRVSGQPAGWGWLLYVFVMGPPGLAGYLLHFRQQVRPQLEAAPLLGTEVFA